MKACEERGHGKWITNLDGIIECHDCGQVLGHLGLEEELNYIDLGDEVEVPPTPRGHKPI